MSRLICVRPTTKDKKYLYWPYKVVGVEVEIGLAWYHGLILWRNSHRAVYQYNIIYTYLELDEHLEVSCTVLIVYLKQGQSAQD